MKKNILLSILLLLVLSGFAQLPKFDGCGDPSSIHYGVFRPGPNANTAPSSIYSIDSATGVSTAGAIITDTDTSTPLQMNGIGTHTDGYMYGISQAAAFPAPANFYQIGSDGMASNLGLIADPPIATGGQQNTSTVLGLMGEIDPNTDTFYVGGVSIAANIFPPGLVNYTFYIGEIDLTLGTAAVTWTAINTSGSCMDELDNYVNAVVAAQIAGTPVPDGGIQDFAFLNGNLVSYIATPEGDQAYLTFDLGTNTATCTNPATTNANIDNLGGFYVEGGVLYGIEADNAASEVYSFDPITGAATLVGTSGLTNIRGDAGTCNFPALLPVELLYFKVNATVGNEVELVWATATEDDNDKFDIHRSADGVNWETIGSVNGAGTSTVTHYYTFIDQTPILGHNFYRLQQIDFDGTITYSDIRFLNIGEEGRTAFFPNPTTDQIFVSGLKDNDQVFVYSVSGKLVKTVPINTGEPLHLGDLVDGMYFVKVVSKGRLSNTLQVVKH